MSASFPGEAGGAGDGPLRSEPPSSARPRVVDPDADDQVRLGNGSRATAITVAPDADPGDVARRLSLEPGRPVLVVLGGADSLAASVSGERIATLGHALARAASQARAVIVDGGTDAGMMAAVGRAFAGDHHRVPLVGVAPGGVVTPDAGAANAEPGQVTLEPNHSHLALVEGGTWGDETPLLIGLADALAGCQPVAVVVGGGDITTREADEALDRRWQVFAVEGSGGTADALAARSRRTVDLLPVTDPDEITRRLVQSLCETPALELAWRRFARYDAAAVRLRRSFERAQLVILGLGVAATLLALLHHALGSHLEGRWAWLRAVLRWTVVAVPIVISMLIAYAGRVHAGKRWVLLRGAAEATKQQIFRYRTGTGVYAADQPAAERTPKEELLERIGTVDAVLMKTEVSGAALPDYDGPIPPAYAAGEGDDGVSPLDPERYLALRVRDQRDFYRSRTLRLERKLRRLQILTVTAGGAGALVAAAGFELWVGLTTTIAGAVAAHLGYLQVEGTLVAYNQAITKLEDVETRALLHLEAGTIDGAFAELVERAETAIQSEHGSWTQQMHESLEQLRPKEQPGATVVAPTPVPGRPSA